MSIDALDVVLYAQLFAIAKFLFIDILRFSDFKIAAVRHLGFSIFAVYVT